MGATKIPPTVTGWWRGEAWGVGQGGGRGGGRKMWGNDLAGDGVHRFSPLTSLKNLTTVRFGWGIRFGWREGGGGGGAVGFLKT